MVKVSITLPNNSQITFESEESEVLHEVVGMVLRDLPRDLMQSSTGGNGLEQNGTAQKSTSVAAAAVTAAAASGQSSETDGPTEVIAPAPRTRRAPTTSTNHRRLQPPATTNTQSDSPPSLQVEDHPEQVSRDFAAFCQSTNPLGDMRRVVVATEGAARYFGADGVTSDDLERLFELAVWRRPGNFTQTLRNAARAKFGWLERIPGRSGRYAATDLGRSVTHTS